MGICCTDQQDIEDLVEIVGNIFGKDLNERQALGVVQPQLFKPPFSIPFLAHHSPHFNVVAFSKKVGAARGAG